MRDRRLRAETLVRIELGRSPHGFVGGLDRQSEGNQTVEVRSAVNQAPLGRSPVAHPRDIEKAAEAARSASEHFVSRGPELRSNALESLASLVEEHGSDLAILECLQTGRSFRDVIRSDIETGVRILRTAAAWARAPEGTVHDLGPQRVGIVELAPRRVRGAVLPGSEALGSAIRQIALGIAGGSGLVILAPPEAPLTVLRLGSLTRDARFPAGSVNILTSDGRDTPERLSESPLVDALDFAGPRDLARRILVGAAKSNLKPVSLELDDKTPCVVFEDGEIGAAVDAIWKSGLTSPCQLPRSIGRVLVHAASYTELASRLTQLARTTVLGHPLDEHTELGPLASSARMRRVLAYAELGRREGARLVAGGARDIEGERFVGNFVEPTVFMDTPAHGRLAREPVEGPVVTLEAFNDEDDALRRLAIMLGRGGLVVFTRDPARAQRFARRLDYGQLWVNGPVRLFPALPHARGGEASLPVLGRSGLVARGLLRTIVVDGSAPPQ